MPQHSMLPDDHNVMGVSIDLFVASPLDPGITARVGQTWDDGVKATVFQQTYEATMVDVLTSLPNDVGLAFLFGTRGDIKRACNTNWRVARAHAKLHELD